MGSLFDKLNKLDIDEQTVTSIASSLENKVMPKSEIENQAFSTPNSSVNLPTATEARKFDYQSQNYMSSQSELGCNQAFSNSEMQKRQLLISNCSNPALSQMQTQFDPSQTQRVLQSNIIVQKPVPNNKETQASSNSTNLANMQQIYLVNAGENAPIQIVPIGRDKAELFNQTHSTSSPKMMQDNRAYIYRTVSPANSHLNQTSMMRPCQVNFVDKNSNSMDGSSQSQHVVNSALRGNINLAQKKPPDTSHYPKCSPEAIKLRDLLANLIKLASSKQSDGSLDQMKNLVTSLLGKSISVETFVEQASLLNGGVRMPPEMADFIKIHLQELINYSIATKQMMSYNNSSASSEVNGSAMSMPLVGHTPTSLSVPKTQTIQNSVPARSPLSVQVRKPRNMNPFALSNSGTSPTVTTPTFSNPTTTNAVSTASISRLTNPMITAASLNQVPQINARPTVVLPNSSLMGNVPRQLINSQTQLSTTTNFSRSPFITTAQQTYSPQSYGTLQRPRPPQLVRASQPSQTASNDSPQLAPQSSVKKVIEKANVEEHIEELVSFSLAGVDLEEESKLLLNPDSIASRRCGDGLFFNSDRLKEAIITAAQRNGVVVSNDSELNAISLIISSALERRIYNLVKVAALHMHHRIGQVCSEKNMRRVDDPAAKLNFIEKIFQNDINIAEKKQKNELLKSGSKSKGKTDTNEQQKIREMAKMFQQQQEIIDRTAAANVTAMAAVGKRKKRGGTSDQDNHLNGSNSSTASGTNGKNWMNSDGKSIESMTDKRRFKLKQRRITKRDIQSILLRESYFLSRSLKMKLFQ